MKNLLKSFKFIFRKFLEYNIENNPRLDNYKLFNKYFV